MRRAVLLLLALPLLVLSVAPVDAALPLSGDEARVGRWDAPMAWPVQGEDVALLPTGKVLVFAYGEDAHLFDPRDGSLTPVPTPVAINCAGLALLPDGRVLVNGGHAESNWRGSAGAMLFNPWTESWEVAPSMNVGRYYPGTITLADGRALTVSGNGPDGRDAATPEVFDGAAWTLLPGATQTMEFYPRMHVLPDGEVVIVGQQPESYFVDAEAGTVRAGPVSPHGMRWGGASVLLSDLRTVLVAGGGSMGLSSEGWALPALRDDAPLVAEHVLEGRAPATASAQLFDARGAGAWRDAATMTYARRDHQLVLLPDGDALAVGGASGYEPVPGWAEHALHPELYDAESDAWRVMAPSARHRGYHSTSILLPDGRVLVSGGDFETGVGAVPGVTRSAEVYAPPYLFRGPRPVIHDAPDALAPGATFRVDSTGDVERVTLVRLGSSTHSLNTDQRVVPLAFEAAPGGLIVRAPAEPGEAPPGWYMLFALSGDGGPSAGRMVRVG